MDDHFMTRKDFLKKCALLVAGIFLTSWEDLRKLFTRPASKHMKEARYYTRGDRLAG